jgi:hypothetical protein
MKNDLKVQKNSKKFVRWKIERRKDLLSPSIST